MIDFPFDSFEEGHLVPDESDQSNSAVHVARINLWQAIGVAGISALAGIATTLIVKEKVSAPEKPTQAAVTPGTYDRSANHFAYRWIYPDKSADDMKCINSAIRVLESVGAKNLVKADTGTTVSALAGDTAIIIACRADHGVAIVTAQGGDPTHSLISLATDIKTRMEAELQAH